ncbi:MAG: hypothetical protein CVU87_08250 [Firmicutes bacterium HGW-Firmicutes-12]|nr:MAG: hypothetical protein CVU87_08250 [Firmicutes bacterium HGW-Firmicutes-12]
MKKIAFVLVLVMLFSLVLSSCLRGTLDKRSGLSQSLKATEDNIRQGNWEQAADNLKISKEAWKGLKPFLQLDIDHDYVNIIEDNFVILSVYIECQEKLESLAAILLLRKNWDNIGEM